MDSLPNLFDYATSELSQDAIIAWLLMWANPEFKSHDEDLHLCSQKIINFFFDAHGKHRPTVINSVKIHKQDCKIDVICIVNDDWHIVIEDKTDTKEHSNQLRRYIDSVVKSGVPEDKVLGIYFKIHEQSSLEGVLEAGFKPFLRGDLLQILSNFDSKNNIFCDFLDKTKELDGMFNSFLTLRPGDWYWHSWIGFYQRLQDELKVGGECWKYVPNKSGGFLAVCRVQANQISPIFPFSR